MTPGQSKRTPSSGGPDNGPEDVESPTAVAEVTPAVADVSDPAPSPAQILPTEPLTPPASRIRITRLYRRAKEIEFCVREDQPAAPIVDRTLNFVFDWETENQFSADSPDIDTWQFVPTGIPLGASFVVDVPAAGIDQQNPSISIDPTSGKFVIAWNNEYGGFLGNSKILAQKYTSDTATPAVPTSAGIVEVNTTGLEQYSPGYASVALRSDGSYVVDYDIFGIVRESAEETRKLSDGKSLPQARIAGLIYHPAPQVVEIIDMPSSVMIVSPIFHLAPPVFEKIDIRPIDLVRVGRSAYRLQQPAIGKFTPGTEHIPGRFEVEGFENLAVGRGGTVEAARADWENRLHAKFQKLYTLQDDEMSTTQRQAWEKLTHLVDVEAYRKTVSVVGREIGQVVASGRHGKVILWQGGRKDTVRLSRAPRELVLVKKGEWLEAMVARHPDSYKIRRILWLKPYTPWDGKLDDAHQAKIERIPTIATLPETTWD